MQTKQAPQSGRRHGQTCSICASPGSAAIRIPLTRYKQMEAASVGTLGLSTGLMRPQRPERRGQCWSLYGLTVIDGELNSTKRRLMHDDVTLLYRITAPPARLAVENFAALTVPWSLKVLVWSGLDSRAQRPREPYSTVDVNMCRIASNLLSSFVHANSPLSCNVFISAATVSS